MGGKGLARSVHRAAKGIHNFDEFGDGLHGYNIARNEKGVIVFDKHIDLRINRRPCDVVERRTHP